MLQTVRSAVLELQPESTGLLRGLLNGFKAVGDNEATAYDSLKKAVPFLHFMSMTIFEDDWYDPILVIEVNFDGLPGPFWSQFEAAFGERFRSVLRCGKTPRDGMANLFTSVTRSGSTAPMAPLLEALARKPAVCHQGNRGLDRSRIEGEGELFQAVQETLDLRYGANGCIAVGGSKDSQQAIHQVLRTALLPRFDWLDAPPVPRITPLDSLQDYLAIVVFALLVVLALLAPGIAVAAIFSHFTAFIILAGAAILLNLLLGRDDRVSLSPQVIGLLPIGLAALAAAAMLEAASVAFLVSFHHGHVQHYGHHWRVCASLFGFGVLGLVPVLLGAVLWIRYLEKRDPPQDAPVQDPAVLRAMAEREDKIAQNHMGSVVHLKPGVLRAVSLRVALKGLGLVLRVVARDGYLGSMRTIHFAHWAIASNGGRLIFFSNFDGSWESYLDDFIEKAHMGLTLAWTSGVGFPPTRFLVLDGATQGRKFKAWARHSMAESLFWFSAYTSFTVNQIERQACLADGLRKASLTRQEAEAWALYL